MAKNITFISRYTVPSDSLSVTLSGITQAYTDLLIIITPRNNGNENQVYNRPNNDTTSNIYYSKNKSVYPAGTPFSQDLVGSRFDTYGMQQGSTNANLWGSNWMYIKNYSSSTESKVYFVDAAANSNTGGNQISMWSYYWQPSTAITSYNFRTQGDGTDRSIVTNSTFDLYGITID